MCLHETKNFTSFNYNLNSTDLFRRMASMPYKQDLPPEGGYAPINYKRIPAKSVLNAPIIFGGLFATMAYGYWSYKKGMRAFRKEVSLS